MELKSNKLLVFLSCEFNPFMLWALKTVLPMISPLSCPALWLTQRGEAYGFFVFVFSPEGIVVPQPADLWMFVPGILGAGSELWAERRTRLENYLPAFLGVDWQAQQDCQP